MKRQVKALNSLVEIRDHVRAVAGSIDPHLAECFNIVAKYCGATSGDWCIPDKNPKPKIGERRLPTGGVESLPDRLRFIKDFLEDADESHGLKEGETDALSELYQLIEDVENFGR